MGLVGGLLLAMVAWTLLWRSRRVGTPALQLAGAALLAGLSGYALQGRTNLSGSPASQRAPEVLPPAIPLELATEYFGRFNGAYSWLTFANGYLKRGDSGSAIQALESGLRARPRDPELWIALGNALIIHAGGRMPPAARLAFETSRRVAPDHPAPPFFFGLAMLGQAQPRVALEIWRDSLASAPRDAPWRDRLAKRIAFVELGERLATPPSNAR